MTLKDTSQKSKIIKTGGLLPPVGAVRGGGEETKGISVAGKGEQQRQDWAGQKNVYLY